MFEGRRFRLGQVVASVAFALVTIANASLARARSETPSPDPSATIAPADCSLVGPSDAARLVGFPVGAADPTSARGGVCFFTTRAVSQEGSLSYSLVTAARLPERRAYFIATTRRCGSVAKGAPNEAICRAFRRLAEATDLTTYFRARTDFPDAIAIPDLGPAAVAAPDAIYVRRGETIFECVVRRGERFDVPRSTELARLLLERAPQP